MVLDLKEEDILGDRIHDHWYYVAKGRALEDFIDGVDVHEVLDVGAGSGVFSKRLLDVGVCDSAVCVDPYYSEERSETHNGKSIKFVKGQAKTTQNLILMMDVLEHVEDDTALLKEYVDSMEVGGKVLITVPAFQFLWSGHDVFLEHYRRYTLKQVEDLILGAGLRTIKAKYFFASLFPLIAIVRFLKHIFLGKNYIKAESDLRIYSEPVNKVLVAIHGVERKTFFKLNRFLV